jgi:polyisoprenoid-binding protein YceI
MTRAAIFAIALSATAVSVHAAPETYSLDPAHTHAYFEIQHFGTSTNRGALDKSTGMVQLDKAAKTGKVELTIDMTSINTSFAAFTKHLQSKDFFNVAEFPTARFVSDKFKFRADKVTEVTGQLTLLGKTNPVTLKATNFNCYQSPMLKAEVCGGDFETTIVRSQYGMTWGFDYGFSDSVRLLVQVEAVKQ